MEEKDEFWDRISSLIENTKGRVIIIGDLNGRVGKRDIRSGTVIGEYGETTRNSNGKRIIDLCIQNDLLVMNSMFEHKDIHKYTRVAPSKNEKSIIDYFIISRTYRREVRDVRVRRGPEINSDHYMVVAKTQIGNRNDQHKNHKGGRK